MKSIKILFTGLSATLSMDIVMRLMNYIAGLAPTNIHPAAAFLYNLGVESQALSTLLHFSYGTLWAIVFVYTFKDDYSIKRGVQLAVALWVFMMLVYSPIIGWGFFGIGHAGLLDSNHPLHLKTTIGYIISTLTVHLAYGTILGALSSYLFAEKSTSKLQ